MELSHRQFELYQNYHKKCSKKNNYTAAHRNYIIAKSKYNFISTVENKKINERKST